MKKRPLLIGFFIFTLIAVFFFIFVYGTTVFIERSPITDEKIAIIRITGIILESSNTIEELEKYNQNPSVKAIILRIDSPGGGVVPSQEIYEEVKKIKIEGKKKIIASMGSVAASGGYYIASASDKIVANPGTLTGSIGVIMELANFEGLLNKVGIESVVVKSGELKDIGSPFRKMSEKERGLLQKLLDDIHGQFIDAVASGRALKKEDIESLADGRVFTGREAKELGLVDELGNLQDAIKVAADAVGIKGKPKIIETKKRFSLIDLLRDFTLLDGMKIDKIIPSRNGTISLKYLLAY